MLTQDDIHEGINSFFSGTYDTSRGRTIPDVADIKFGKEGRTLSLAMLFIDIKESTMIVDNMHRVTAARMYKSFLWGVAQIARANDGELRSFNGDGVLVAFLGDSKCTNAAKASLQLSWFVEKVLKPKMQSYFSENTSLKEIEFDCGIGIDSGEVLVVRGGIRGENNNDLVWVGNATNYAVKLSGLSKDGYRVYISRAVYQSMNESSKFGGNPRKNMWESRTWNVMDNLRIYRSSWTWSL